METVELSFFVHLFIYSFSPLTVGRRDEDKKWNILKYIYKYKKELGQYPAILTSRLVNNAHEYILCRPVQIWQGKTVQKMPFRAQNLSNVWVGGLPFPCNSVHEVLTSALMTEVYRQSLSHLRVWANDIKRAIGQRSHCFCVRQFDAKSTSVSV